MSLCYNLKHTKKHNAELLYVQCLPSTKATLLLLSFGAFQKLFQVTIIRNCRHLFLDQRGVAIQNVPYRHHRNSYAFRLLFLSRNRSLQSVGERVRESYCYKGKVLKFQIEQRQSEGCMNLSSIIIR